MDFAIIPECYIDTTLIETLVPPTNRYNHQKGCNNVAKIMKTKFTNSFALGIIDKDKLQLDYLKEFTEICSSDSIVLYKHKLRPQFIIQIAPAVERFIITSAEAGGISLNDFDLPADLNTLLGITKTLNSQKDPRFKRLFKALLEKRVPEIVILKALISYFKNTAFKADISELQRIMTTNEG